MKFDLRLPIGILFSIYGVMLVIFGLMTRDQKIYDRSLGININFRWGLVLLIFGIVMLLLALLGKCKDSSTAADKKS
jgi:hypothetical protein